MPLIAGVDSSTQSTKIEIRDLASGEVTASSSAPHPDVVAPVSEQDPESWWTAFNTAWTEVGAPTVAAISVAGQQHGMVALDEDATPVHPAKLWNDTQSAPDAEILNARLGGPAAWANAVGSVPVAAFTVTKLAWLQRCRPDAWKRVAKIMLPHDYLTARLTGSITPGAPIGQVTTDRGDASGSGYWSPASGKYRWDVLDLIDAQRDWSACVPEVLGPREAAGQWMANGNSVVAPGTGDNMAGALGVGLQPGDTVISIGTSGTVYAVSNTPTADPTGVVAGFADATGRYLPLVCTSNAAKVLDAIRHLLNVEYGEFDRLALTAEPGGPVLLPYFDGERTPNRPEATGVLDGIRSDITREQFARAAVNGVACGLLDGFDALRQLTHVDGRVFLTGGAARSQSVQQVLAGMIDAPVVISQAQQAVATGAAVQAAAVFEQVEHAVIQHRWGLGKGVAVQRAVLDETLRDRYATLRDR
ncbi:MAG: xylulokinase [Ilumatobacter sp.]|nr:xylulokinase [Ilumatobacter sp.]